MAKTVNGAFEEFMKDIVNLDKDITSQARSSRDNLVANIMEFSNQTDFFRLCSDFNIYFGSFARRTKCRPLDDVDIMIGIAAEGATYDNTASWDDISIVSNRAIAMQNECSNEDGTLNSTKVINKFKKKLQEVREYKRSDVHRSGEAVVLNLKSKEWSFDIVPCFHTVKESDGRDYYLIPNGSGKWKKTDPRKDRDHVSQTNQDNDGKVLELIRLCKKWNKVKNAKTIPSYLLETMVIGYCDSTNNLSDYIDFRFRDALQHIANHAFLSVDDMKDIQGNINTLTYDKNCTLRDKAQLDYEKACEAWIFEQKKDQKAAIGKWEEILGKDFPDYDE